MIEFYNNFFKKNYKSKIHQLNNDLEKLFQIYEINVPIDDKNYLNKDYKQSIDDETWDSLNSFYYFISKNKDLPKIFQKFIKKNKAISKPHMIDTFAGAGGMSLGFENAGFTSVFVNEIDERLLETYYFNRDLGIDNYHCGDISKFNSFLEEKSISKKNIEILIGGPPCQGFSNANRQRVIDDPRNILYKSFVQLVAKLRPNFFVMENVRGMMNKSDEIIADFKDSLGADYRITTLLLNAKDFGIPQNRVRFFLIGSSSNNFDPKEFNEKIFSHTIKDGYVLNDALIGLPKLFPKKEKNKKIENPKVGYKFRKYNLNSKYSNYINNSNGDLLSNHTNRYNNERDIEIFTTLPQGADSLHESIRHIMPYKTRNNIFKDKYFKLKSNEVSKTITAHMSLDCNMYIHPTQARGLSPREAARIQTFPDEYIFMGANNSWYKQIGNAVPVKLAEIIAKEIMELL